MTECDIWIKVFDKLGFKFIEEYSSQSKINFLVYRNDDGDYNLYFNRETDEVLSTKQLFIEENKNLFRDVKLELMNI
jgi:hypothetical protein